MKHFPSKDEILAWLAENPTKTNKRDIGRAFGIKGSARIELKRVLRELQADGKIKRKSRRYSDPNTLAPVSVLEVNAPLSDGDLTARPLEWSGEGKTPQILYIPNSKDPALKEGDRILARLTKTPEGEFDYEGRLIRRIGTGPAKILGLFEATPDGYRIKPIDKKHDREWQVANSDTNKAREGELVEAEAIGKGGRMGLPQARVVARLGDPSAPKSISLIAIHQHGIPFAFPDDVINEAEAAKPVSLGKRTDLRELPLITIDPSDARDHDDAVCALPDADPKNEGGHLVWVAIADVAHYVPPGSALDREARQRGNSTYFPDRVVPMLPEALSADLCSLHEGVERPCLAVEMQLSASGEKLSHRFVRGLMRSPASLSYEQAQAAADGTPDDATKPHLDTAIKPLWAAYASAQKARARRQPLDLDLPERHIVLAEDGQVTSVQFRERFDAHKLIEEFMILANVCAAETLEKHRVLYRVHEEPSPEKLDSLREVAGASGLVLAKGQVLKTQHLNKLLHQAAGTENAELINMSVLRSMTQAYYAPSNFGHFGLNLRAYAHFTSPIRRYADLIVHRALIAAHGWGEDGLSPQEETMLEETGTLISQTERRSMIAERDTNDRYLAAYLSEHVGSDLTGRVSGIAKFGLFIKLDGTGADGLVPLSTLGHEYYAYDARTTSLKGEKTGRVIAPGMEAKVRIAEAVPVTGGLTLELLELEGKALPRPTQSSRKRGQGRKMARAKIKRNRSKPRR